MIQRMAQIAAWTLGAALMILAWGPVGLRPQWGHPQAERFAFYLLLATLFALAYPRRRGWIAASMAVAIVALEIGQRFIPRRDAGLDDAVAKLIGAACGLILAAAIHALWRAAARARAPAA